MDELGILTDLDQTFHSGAGVAVSVHPVTGDVLLASSDAGLLSYSVERPPSVDLALGGPGLSGLANALDFNPLW